MNSLQSPEFLGLVPPDLIATIRDEADGSSCKFVQLGELGLKSAAFEFATLSHQRLGLPPPAPTSRISINTSLVEPGTSQRIAQWHVDAGSHTSFCMTSDNLPTESIVGSLTKRVRRRICHISLSDFLCGYTNESHSVLVNELNKLPDEAILDFGLLIEQPQPGELLHVRDAVIHRSAANRSDKPVRRTWVALEIVNGGRGF